MSQRPSHDRIAACLLAGALGDAIGSAFEGRESIAGFDWPDTLHISDDTQLTLATCESIIDRGAVDPESIAKQFAAWHRDRRITGVGASTLKALVELEAGGHWALVGASGERAAGNGAAMRIAPLAFLLDPEVAADRQIIRDVSRITHRNDEAYVGALAILRSIRYLWSGSCAREGLLPSLLKSLPDSRVRERLIEVQQDSLTIEQYAYRFNSSGYVVDSVPLAILAATNSNDLLSTLRQLIQCGGDTDTIASMFSQLFGAACGMQALPMGFIARIQGVSFIRETIDRFVQSAGLHQDRRKSSIQ